MDVFLLLLLWVPCNSCALTRHRSWHSDWAISHAFLLEYGRFCAPVRISAIEIALTTLESMATVKWHIWHLGDVHETGFLDAKSEGRLAAPAIWSITTWWRLAAFRNDDNLALAENSPLQSFL